MNLGSWKRAVTSAALVTLGITATGCIAVSRSTRSPAIAPPVVQEVAQEWSCEHDEAFDLVVARTDLRERIERLASDGWTFVDFEVGRVRERTCLIASFQRPALD